MIVWAVDTGISRNASALARVRLVGKEWRAHAWKWQGSSGSPLSIEHTMAPEVARLWAAKGRGPLAADGYYAPELRRGLGAGVEVTIQGGALRGVYQPTRRLVHHETEQTLLVSPVGWVWTGEAWERDARTGERVIAGIKALEAEHLDGEIHVSLPEAGQSHHDEAVAVMRALWHAGAAGPSRAGEALALQELNALQRHPRAVGPVPYRTGKGAPLVSFKHPRSRQ
jgi:hypothetical protein